MCGSSGKFEFPEDMGPDKLGGQAVERKPLPTKRAGPMFVKRR
jgi:hypothetical protein